MTTHWEDRRVVVTGGAGFIGSYLVEELVERGANVVVADNFSRGKKSNLDHIRDDEIRPVDLTTSRGCNTATEGVDDVFHLAATVGGIHYLDRANIAGLTPNVLMNHKMLEAARRNDISRFLFASSACVYRQMHEGLNLFEEEQAITAAPQNTYGWAKLGGEIACEAYHRDCELEIAVVRIFNCYGPREHLDPDSSHVIPSLCRKVITEPEGGTIELFGDGSQRRGFVYVTDLVDGLIEIIEKKTDGEPINLGNSKKIITINDLANLIISISGKDITVDHDLSKPTGTDAYAADMTQIESELDWKPEVKLEDGLRNVYNWAEERLEGIKR